ncbi:MAG: phosphodiesterase [Alkalilacustris sp.]
MKILHLTDLHLLAPGERRHGLDPGARLRAVLAHALRHHGDADLMVVTGDLADHGDPAAYADLALALSDLSVPVRLLLGNHDDRSAFLDRFGDAAGPGGFIHGVADLPGALGRLLFLDTLEPGWIGGRLCHGRLDWLDRTLAEAPDAPLTVFMHHPPGPVGVPHFARIGLHDADALGRRLARHPGGVRHIFCGHVHLDITGTLSGLPFTARRAVSHQMALSFDTPTPDWMDSPPAYGVILLEDNGLLSFFQDTTDRTPIGRTRLCAGP